MDKELEERLDFIEFKQELLFSNSTVSRLLFDFKVTRDQHKALMDLFSEYRKAVDNGESVSSMQYEVEIGEIVPHQKHNHHFAEFLAKDLHEEGRFQEVFEALYGDSPKFKNYLESNKGRN